MTRYQLGKIVEWAGTLQSRKRMQKLVFLLQAAGCPLDVDYDLHHYGPYSEDLARLTDLMVDERLLEERIEVRPYGEQYSYRLSPESIRQIAEYESRLASSGLVRPMAAFEPLARFALRDRSQGVGGRLDDRLLPRKGTIGRSPSRRRASSRICRRVPRS